MKVRQILQHLRSQGWYCARMRGSHRQLKHPWLQGTVTIAGNLGKELRVSTLKSILRQARR